MMSLKFLLSLLVISWCLLNVQCAGCSNLIGKTAGPWGSGNTLGMNGYINFDKPSGTSNTENMIITFGSSFKRLGGTWTESGVSCIVSRTDDFASKKVTMRFMFHSECMKNGRYFIGFSNLDYLSSGKPNIVSFKIGSTDLCGGTKPTQSPTPPPTRKPTTPYTGPPTTRPPQPTSGPTSSPTANTCGLGHDYRTVLRLSNLFYKAQRSGRLPDNDVPWRKSSFTPLSQDGVNLEGGYFDAGDFVKFGFPGAATITVLAWGMVDFADGYRASGLYDKGLQTLKWQTDYFIRANAGSPGNPVFYAQCGDGFADHAFWGRPEDYTPAFPCFKIDKSHPGTEVAAETAAALAASSIAFKSSDPSYSQTLLKNAKELYDFGKNYKGKYTDSIPAGSFYGSFSGYYDELALAAVWLYRATQDANYLSEAEGHWNNIGDKTASEFSWDNKARGVALLLSKFSKSPGNYKGNPKDFCEKYLPSKPKSPRGTVFISEWGSNRHAGNVAFICLMYAKYHSDAARIAKDFGKKTINSMLGDQNSNTRSYVVGYGFNPPVKPHHRPSSCQLKSVKWSCDWNDYNSGGPNPQVLKGALLGGPKNAYEGYVDDRSDYVRNEVAIDYNAGFQSAVAGVIDFEVHKNC